MPLGRPIKFTKDHARVIVMTKTTTQIAKNVGTSWIATFAQAAIGLFMVPFLLGHLGKEGFGICSLLGVIVSTTAMVDLGLRGALQRQLAEKRAQQDEHGFAELATTAMTVYLALAFLLVAGLLVSSHWLIVLFNVPEHLVSQALLLFRLTASVQIFAAFMTPVFSAALACENRFDITNNIQAGSSFLQAGVIVAVVGMASDPLSAWGWGVAFMALTRFLLLVVFAKRLSPWLLLSPSNIVPRHLKELLRLGGYMYTFQMAGMLSVSANPVILSNAMGPASLAMYSPGSQLFDRIRSFAQSLATQLDPLTTQYHVRGEQQHLRTVLCTGSRLTMLMGFPFCILFGVLSRPVISVWLGNSLGADASVAVTVLIAWAIIHFQNYCTGTQWSVLLGMNRVGFLVFLALPSAGLNIICSILLVRLTNLGVLGVLIPTVVLNAFVYPIAVWYTAKCVNLSLWDYFYKACWPALKAVVPLLIVSLLFLFFWPTTSFLPLFIQMVFCGAVYVVGLIAFGLLASERSMLLAKIVSITKIFHHRNCE